MSDPLASPPDPPRFDPVPGRAPRRGPGIALPLAGLFMLGWIGWFAFAYLGSRAPGGGPAPRPVPAPAPRPEPEAAPPAPEEGPAARLVFDNGTDAPLAVAIAGGRSFEVRPRATATVPGRERHVRFAAAGATLTADLAPGHVYVFNPNGAWDYRLETRNYAAIALLAGDGSDALVPGAVFFDAGAPDKLFEALPATITVESFSAVASASRRALQHASEAPASGRAARVESGPAGEVRVVDLGSAGVALQPASTLEPPTARLFVDDASDASMTVRLAGLEVARLDPGEQRCLWLPPGAWSLSAARDGAAPSTLSAEVVAGKRYCWTPERRREYVIEHQRYGPLFFGGSHPREPERARGLAFFEVPTDYAFEPFPDTVKSQFGMGTEKTRLVLGEPGEPAAESDVDRALPLGAEQDAAGDLEAAEATYSTGIAFAPSRAALWRARGLVRARLEGRASDAKDDLEKALSLDAGLAAELQPRIAELAKAVEAARAEEERKAKEAAEAAAKERRELAAALIAAVPEDPAPTLELARAKLAPEAAKSLAALLAEVRAAKGAEVPEARRLALAGLLAEVKREAGEADAPDPTPLYDGAIELAEGDALGYRLRGLYRAELELHGFAREDLEKALELDPAGQADLAPIAAREKAAAARDAEPETPEDR
ncbi:MAG TPA: tetratricopeptide repeat protein [Planctomycetota bacterium]|nr:tetratricopeptide repeat protein [Planctomycetota bacterium]